MTAIIAKKIVGYSVVTGQPETPPVAVPDVLTESTARPDVLQSASYKIKTPVSDHAIYVTIGDIVLNPGTEHECRRPFEIFINSKAQEHAQWVTAMTLIISAVFRKGGDMAFLVEELRSVHDPRGGWWEKDRYIPSLVAKIGDVLHRHLVSIGMIREPEKDPAIESLKAEKRAQVGDAAVPGATLCPKCNTKAVVRLDGCMTCTNCGDSKCG